MQLRNYQQDCLDRSLEHYRSGINRQLAVLATGLGKTAIASSLHSHHGFGRKCLFLVHMETLAVQAANAMLKWNPTLRTGVEMAGSYADLDGIFPPTFIVASVPTLGRKGSDRIKRFDPADYDCIIQDECFPAGTLVGGVPIENIAVGDVTPSFDEVRGRIINKRVIGVSKKQSPEHMVKIMCGRTILVCTINHPIFTGKGWQYAATLRPGDCIMLELPQAGRRAFSDERAVGQISEYRTCVLLRQLLEGGPISSGIEASAGDGSQLRIEEDEGKQPDEERKQSGEDAPNLSQHRAQATRSWRQRYGSDYSAERAFAEIANIWRSVFMDTGVRGSDRNELSTMLQGGHREPIGEASGGSGRQKPRPVVEEATRPEERRDTEWRWVDSVEILERGRVGEPDALCPDGFVYNLEVEDTHTYFANGVLVHNCHIGMADSFKRVYDHFGLLTPNPDGPLFLGITATPNRSDGKGLRELFDMIVFDMGIQKGIADGWLCDLVGYRVNGKAKLDGIKTRAGDFAQDELSDEVNTPQRNGIIVKEWYKVAYGKRTLAFTVDVQHALDLAAAFTAHGETAEAVWGDDPDRHEKIRRHKTGEFNVLCNCNVLAIGYDDPQIQCIISAAPTKSELRYVQQIGRGTRIAEGKESCIVLDVVDNSSKHRLTTISTLLGFPKDLDLKGEKYSVAKQKLDRIAAEFPTANIQDIKSLDQLKSIAENIQLFTVNYPPEISKLSELAWRKSAEGYVLAVNRDLVTIMQDLRGDWVVRGRIGEKQAEISAQNMPGAFNAADRFILDSGGVKGYLSRNARWRTERVPPTPAMLKYCQYLKIAHLITPQMTKGEVGNAIDNQKAKLRAQGVNV